jgi:hypothetical protein
MTRLDAFLKHNRMAAFFVLAPLALAAGWGFQFFRLWILGHLYSPSARPSDFLVVYGAIFLICLGSLVGLGTLSRVYELVTKESAHWARDWLVNFALAVGIVVFALAGGVVGSMLVYHLSMNW